MSLPDRYGIIANFDILSEDYIPENIPGREQQIKELGLSLDPVSKRKKPMNSWLYGPPGAGKGGKGVSPGIYEIFPKHFSNISRVIS